MSRQSVFTAKEPNIDRIHDKLEFITRNHHLDSMSIIYNGIEYVLTVIATIDTRTY